MMMALAALCVLASGNVNAEVLDGWDMFKSYERPGTTAQPGRRWENIVVGKAFTTDATLFEIAFELYGLTAGDTLDIIDVYTDTWAATTAIKPEDMTPTQYRRFAKAYVGQFSRKPGQKVFFDYAPGGLFGPDGEPRQFKHLLVP